MRAIKRYGYIPLFLIFALVLFWKAPIPGVAQDTEPPAPGGAEDDAQFDITIDFVGAGLQKTSIAIPDIVNKGGVPDAGQLGIEGAKILTQDLKFSSYFDPVSPSAFLERPEERQFTADKINFKNWSAIPTELLIVGFYTIKKDGNMDITLRLFDVETKS